MSYTLSTADPSTPIKPPLHLPNEILQRIAQLVDDEDLPALRATSRVFRDEVEVRFADAYFTDVYYPPTPEGIERLTKIAEHPLFSLKIGNYIATTKKPLVKYSHYQIQGVLKDTAAAMQGKKNLGVLLVDDPSQRSQNTRALQYATYLERCEPEKFIVNVQHPIGSTSDLSFFVRVLYHLQLRMKSRCTFVIRFLHKKTRDAPALATIELTQHTKRQPGLPTPYRET